MASVGTHPEKRLPRSLRSLVQIFFRADSDSAIFISYVLFYKHLKIVTKSGGDYGFDCVHTVFGFIKNHRLPAFKNLVCNLH